MLFQFIQLLANVQLFSEVSKTCAGCPLRSYDLFLHYLGDTTTKTGLRVAARLVTTAYAKGIKVSDTAMAALYLQQHAICPQWNYTISPRTLPSPT